MNAVGKPGAGDVSVAIYPRIFKGSQVPRQGVDKQILWGDPYEKIFPQRQSSFKITSCGFGCFPLQHRAE